MVRRILGSTLLISLNAHAHPAHLGQALYVEVRVEHIGLELTLSPGTEVASRFSRALDVNGDGQVSSGENAIALQQLAGQLELRVDGIPRAVEGLTLEAPTVDILNTGEATARWTGRSLGGISAGRHTLQLINHYHPVQSAYMTNAFAIAGPAEILSQTRAPLGHQLTLSLRIAERTQHSRPQSRPLIAVIAVALLLTLGALVWRGVVARRR